MEELDIIGYLSFYIPESDRHQIQYTLKYSYYKSSIPVLDKLEISHPKKKHRKNIVNLLDKVRKEKRADKIYKTLIEEFYEEYHLTDNTDEPGPSYTQSLSYG